MANDTESSTIYEGEYNENGERHGKGKLVCGDDGYTYEGGVVYLNYYGYGKLTFKNGKVYEGVFNFGEFNGVGKLTYRSGKVIEGLFKDGEYLCEFAPPR